MKKVFEYNAIVVLISNENFLPQSIFFAVFTLGRFFVCLFYAAYFGLLFPLKIFC